MSFHTNLGGSPALLTTHAAAREWLQQKDASRLDTDKLERPNTKWVFLRWVQVEVKAILVEQPLLGQGLLPDWLRNKKGLYALDTFDDNMCLFRCIAVHRGVRPDRCTKEAIELSKQFWVGSNDQQVQALRAVELTELKKVEEKFKLGIRVYEPSEDSTSDVLWKNVASDKIIENELRLISHLLGIALSEYVLNMCNFSLKLRLWHWQNLVSTLCVTYLIGIT